MLMSDVSGGLVYVTDPSSCIHGVLPMQDVLALNPFDRSVFFFDRSVRCVRVFPSGVTHCGYTGTIIAYYACALEQVEVVVDAVAVDNGGVDNECTVGDDTCTDEVEVIIQNEEIANEEEEDIEDQLVEGADGDGDEEQTEEQAEEEGGDNSVSDLESLVMSDTGIDCVHGVRNKTSSVTTNIRLYFGKRLCAFNYTERIIVCPPSEPLVHAPFVCSKKRVSVRHPIFSSRNVGGVVGLDVVLRAVGSRRGFVFPTEPIILALRCNPKTIERGCRLMLSYLRL
jgi:hypothetical protein